MLSTPTIYGATMTTHRAVDDATQHPKHKKITSRIVGPKYRHGNDVSESLITNRHDAMEIVL